MLMLVNPSDIRCRRHNYIALQACDIMAKFTKIRFFGDSLMHKLYRAFILVMASDPIYGAAAKRFTPELAKLCTGNDQFYWRECRFIGESLNDLVNQSSLCGGKGAPFTVENLVHYGTGQGPRFVNLVKKLAGQPGSLIMLGVGFHMKCDSSIVMRKSLGPALDYLDKYYSERYQNQTGMKKWPFISPNVPKVKLD